MPKNAPQSGRTWSEADIPPLHGRLAVITGTGGLGYETALQLAKAGAEIVLAGRNAGKGAEAVSRIATAVPGASIAFETLDLASLRSVATFSERMGGARPAIDLLVNNAGVMAPPRRQTTEDGFELQFGTNYLGHFALTLRLLPLLRQGRAPRVVSVSSIAHRQARIAWDDLQTERPYKPWRAYGQSKLAMLLFALELQRRSDEAGWGLMSNAAHPGYARTELMANGPGVASLVVKLGRLFEPLVSQNAAAGALPILYAATSPDATGGAYYGPDGAMELKGAPRPARIMPQASDKEAAARLWAESERLAGVGV